MEICLIVWYDLNGKDILRNRHASVKFAKENNMEWFGIVALLLLLCYTEEKDKQVVKLMRIENIESIEEQ